MVVLLAGAVSGLAQDATEVVRRADAKMRGATMQAELVIRTVRPSWTREMSVKTWAKGTQFTLILITAPQKDAGISFLKRKKEVWMQRS